MEQAQEKQLVTMRITYSELELKELSELLYIINLSINDYFRDQGISGPRLRDYAPTVKAVRQGSIEVDLLLTILGEIAVSVAAELLAGYLRKRIRMLQEKYESGKARKQIFDYKIASKIEAQLEADEIIIEVKP